MQSTCAVSCATCLPSTCSSASQKVGNLLIPAVSFSLGFRSPSLLPLPQSYKSAWCQCATVVWFGTLSCYAVGYLIGSYIVFERFWLLLCCSCTLSTTPNSPQWPRVSLLCGFECGWLCYCLAVRQGCAFRPYRVSLRPLKVSPLALC